MASPTNNSVATTFVELSGDDQTDSLVSTGKWGGALGTGVELTYSYITAASVFDDDYNLDNDPSDDEPANPFFEISAQDKADFEEALEQWANVADITFVEVTDNASVVGEIRVGLSDVVDDVGAAGYAYLPFGTPSAGDVWLSPELFGDDELSAFDTMRHEIGHALGLSHPFDGDITLPDSQDSMFFTVMSYSQASDAFLGDNDWFTFRRPDTPMLVDIKTIQYLYGPNMTYHAGDDIYTFSEDEEYLMTIWDAGGNDTIVHDGSGACVIDLREGKPSELGVPVEFFENGGFIDDVKATDPRTVWIAYDCEIEHATGGSGADRLTGNDLANTLDGGNGSDQLSGGKGSDTLLGGKGGDTLTGSGGGDVLTGAGGNDSMTGGGGADNLNGGGGADTLNGGGGHDTLAGGTGADTFVFATAITAASTDVINDFVAADDTIRLDNDIFTALGAATGTLAGSRFKANADGAATDSNDRIVYDTTSGELYYDADGSGAGVKVLFATLTGAPTLTAADFAVVN